MVHCNIKVNETIIFLNIIFCGIFPETCTMHGFGAWFKKKVDNQLIDGVKKNVYLIGGVFM